MNKYTRDYVNMFRCRYSQALKPIFDKTAESLHNDHPVSILRVTCCYSNTYVIIIG